MLASQPSKSASSYATSRYCARGGGAFVAAAEHVFHALEFDYGAFDAMEEGVRPADCAAAMGGWFLAMGGWSFSL